MIRIEHSRETKNPSEIILEGSLYEGAHNKMDIITANGQLTPVQQTVSFASPFLRLLSRSYEQFDPLQFQCRTLGRSPISFVQGSNSPEELAFDFCLPL
jgi:hypothetical protein